MHASTSKFLLVAVICLLFLPQAAWASEPPIRDTWAVTEKDGDAIGLTHTRVWPTETGYHYLIDVTQQIQFLGSAPTRIFFQYDVYTNASRVLESFTNSIQVNDSRTIITGILQGRTLNVSMTTPDGNTGTSKWTFDDNIYFEDGLFEQMATQPINPGTQIYRIWDFNRANVKTISYTVQDSSYEYHGQTIRGYIVRDAEGTETFVGSSGIVYWINMPKDNVKARTISENEIPELKSLAMDTLTVPGNITVEHPFSSTTSKIQVTWRDVPFAKFNWEDNRQRLVQSLPQAADQSVELAIRRDDRDFTGKVTLPVKNAEFSPYLNDADFVMPSSPSVQQIARTILGNEKDGWAVTRKLVDWVFNYIQPALIPETLTVEQILQKKQGKCTEYAVLFASLARAAGLPTRIALGERFESNMWVGHMWNEVWLGEWVAVDASHNQVAPDALLLKFVHSEGVRGTQEVRVGLIGKLGIKIADVFVPEQTIAGAKTGIVGQTYTNVSYRCRLAAPAGWTLTEAQEQGSPMIVMSSPADAKVHGIGVMFSIPAGTKAEHITAARIPAIRQIVTGFNLLSQSQQKLGEQNLLASTAAWTLMDNNVQVRQENWIVTAGNMGYLLVFSAPASTWAANEAYFQQIRDSFSLLQ